MAQHPDFPRVEWKRGSTGVASLEPRSLESRSLQPVDSVRMFWLATHRLVPSSFRFCDQRTGSGQTDALV